MGTTCELQLYGQSKIQTRNTAAVVLNDVERLEAKYSRYRADSLLSEINQVASRGSRLKVDEETAKLLDYASTCYMQSDGLFDITSGILRQVWDFKSGRLPESNSIDAMLSRIGWDRVEWESPNLGFTQIGMELDFGGIVKEYAVDRAAIICMEQGIEHGMINLGGDVRVIGPHPDGTPWRIAIQNPDSRQSAVQMINFSYGALATSGDYERCIIIDGKRYGHILNPKTGWPVSHLAAVSVAADLCVVAGSASTIGILKEKAGGSWLRDLQLPYLWVDVNGNSEGPLLN